MKTAGSAFELRSRINDVALASVGHVHAARTVVDPPTLPLKLAAPSSVTPSNNLTERNIGSDPRDSYFLWLPSKLNPNQILQILRAALGGDLWRMSMLLQLMLDSWPMLRKCSKELRDPVSTTRFTVKAYESKKGEGPTDEAQKKADLVRRAQANFAPNRFTDEKNWTGMVYQTTEALLSGLTMEELIWHEPTDWGAGIEVLPRAAGWVHPRHFTFALNGVIGLSNKPTNQMAWPIQGVLPVTPPDLRKYLCAQFYSDSGSTLNAGLMRSLAWAWAAVMFNREWMFVAAKTTARLLWITLTSRGC